MSYLEVIDLRKNYGYVKALRGVSFSVDKGSYVVILGPTGAGKTTLLKIIAGLLTPDHGRVMLEGEDITYKPPELRGMTYMPQGYALFPHMTVWENVCFGAEVRGISMDTVKEILEIVGLYHRRDSYPDQLSGGQQQRVALARSLASGSKIVLLDEPLSALDLLLNVELRYELKRLAKKLELTVIHVTHNYEEALSIADKIVIMRRGRIEQVGKPEEIYKHPKTVFVANFIGEINYFEGNLHRGDNKYDVVEVSDIGGILVPRGLGVEGHVIIAFRPEDLELYKNSPPPINSFKSRISSIEFHGLRYRVMLNVGAYSNVKVDLWFKKPHVKVGSEVYVHMPPERALVFEYPKEGLISALSVE